MALRLDVRTTRESVPVRFARERAELVAARPRLAAFGRGVWRRPWAMLPVAFVAFGALGAAYPGSDAALFVAAGRGMVGPGFWNVFADPQLQLGPLDVLVTGLVTRFADLLGWSALFLVAAVRGVLMLALAQAVAARAARRSGSDPTVAVWVISLMLVAAGPGAEASLMGHAEEIGLGLALAWAALDCADGRRWSVGIVLGLAVGVKLWAVLGIPVVLLDRRWWPAVQRALVAGVVVLVLYAPFFLWGDVRTFELRWMVVGASGVGYLLGLGSTVGWNIRLAQVVLVVATGAWLALRRRADPLAVVVALVATRLLLDPIRFPYYWGPLLALLVIWTWTSAAPGVRRWRVPVLAATPLVTLAPYVLWIGTQVVLGTLCLVAVLALVVRESLRATDEVLVPEPV